MQSDSEHSPSTTAHKVIPIPAHTFDEKEDFFEDNLEHLQALENEARLRLLIAFLQKGNLSFSKEKTTKMRWKN